MFFDHNHNNLYKYLAINFFCNFRSVIRFDVSVKTLLGNSFISDIKKRNAWKNKNFASNGLGYSTLKTLNATNSNAKA